MAASESLSSQQFGNYKLAFTPSPNEDEHHRVSAIHEGTQVGGLMWNPNSGATHVEVTKKHQRKGVATAMWHFAHSVASSNDLTEPVHSFDQSPAGARWADKVGGEYQG